MEIVTLLSEAERYFGKLDMYSEYIPNREWFISMYVTKDATQSTKIEGTQTGIEEAILDRENVKPEKRNDWEEVQNYIVAMDYAVKELKNLSFCVRLIKNTHKILLQSVKGKNKSPGVFKRNQNWIGGIKFQDAVFIRPYVLLLRNL